MEVTTKISIVKRILTSQDFGEQRVAEWDVGLRPRDGADALAQLEQALVDVVALGEALALSLGLRGTLRTGQVNLKQKP